VEEWWLLRYQIHFTTSKEDGFQRLISLKRYFSYFFQSVFSKKNQWFLQKYSLFKRAFSSKKTLPADQESFKRYLSTLPQKNSLK